jgi:hypothetical protein
MVVSVEEKVAALNPNRNRDSVAPGVEPSSAVLEIKNAVFQTINCRKPFLSFRNE